MYSLRDIVFARRFFRKLRDILCNSIAMFLEPLSLKILQFQRHSHQSHSSKVWAQSPVTYWALRSLRCAVLPNSAALSSWPHFFLPSACNRAFSNPSHPFIKPILVSAELICQALKAENVGLQYIRWRSELDTESYTLRKIYGNSELASGS